MRGGETGNNPPREELDRHYSSIGIPAVAAALGYARGGHATAQVSPEAPEAHGGQAAGPLVQAGILQG